ncbi:MAG: tetratricopeptide repeat protein [Pseudomonadota bacterium]
MIDLRVTLKALVFVPAILCATAPTAQEAAPDAPGIAPALPELPSDPAPAAPEVLSEDPQILLDRLGTLTEEDGGEAIRLAAEIMERWTHSGSAAMDLLLVRGKDAIEAEDYVRAIAHLTALTDHAPQFAEAWNQRATAFFLMERYGEALSDIEQVLILEPRHFNALAGLGIILDQLGEEKAALRAFRAAQDAHPAEPNVNAAVERLEQQTGGRTL